MQFKHPFFSENEPTRSSQHSGTTTTAHPASFGVAARGLSARKSASYWLSGVRTLFACYSAAKRSCPPTIGKISQTDSPCSAQKPTFDYKYPNYIKLSFLRRTLAAHSALHIISDFREPRSPIAEFPGVEIRVRLIPNGFPLFFIASAMRIIGINASNRRMQSGRIQNRKSEFFVNILSYSMNFRFSQRQSKTERFERAAEIPNTERKM